MRRSRDIASTPMRNAGSAWSAISELVGVTLERSECIGRAVVDEALASANGVGRMLVGGGHLDKSPLTLVAGKLFVEITTVSGDAALRLEENLNPVPGAAEASDWTLHLPTPAALATVVQDFAANHAHFSAGEAVEPIEAVAASAGSTSMGLIDPDALARWAEEGK